LAIPTIDGATLNINRMNDNHGTTQIELNQAVSSVKLTLHKDDTEVHLLFVNNLVFKRFLTELVVELVSA
jgi:hypothetical protein